MSDPPDEARLKRLEERIARLRATHQPDETPHQETHYSQAQTAWRMVIELVAGLGIGFGIGMGLDALAGTRPLFLVLFTLLGFAAGVQTMLRTANEVQEKRAADRVGEDAAGSADDDADGSADAKDDRPGAG